MVACQKVPTGPCLLPVLVPLGGSPALKDIARSLQFGVTHRLDKLCLFPWISDKDVEEDQSWDKPLQYLTVTSLQFIFMYLLT